MGIWNSLIKEYRQNGNISFQKKSPRGSSNPINSYEKSSPDQNMLKHLSNYELPYLYAADFELNLIAIDAMRFIVNHSLIMILNSIAVRISTDLCGITSIIDADKLCSELRSSSHFFRKNDEIDISPEMHKLETLQYSIQHLIEEGDWDWKHKAESFLEAQTISDLENCENEVLIYMLTRQEKSDRIHRVESMYNDSSFSGNDSFSINEILDIKDHLVSIEDRLIRVFDLYHKYSKKTNGSYQYNRGDFLKTPDILRVIQEKSVRYLRAFIAQSPESTRQKLLPEQVADFSKPFSVLRCTIALGIMKSEIEKLMVDIHCLLEEYVSAKSLPDTLIKEKVPTSALVALYIFGCYRLNTDLRKEKTFDLGLKYLMSKGIEYQPLDLPDSVPPYNGINARAMVIHALSYTKFKDWKSFVQPLSKWLRDQQSKYGCWFDWGDNPSFTTVLVLDALELAEGGSQVTFKMPNVAAIDSITSSLIAPINIDTVNIFENRLQSDASRKKKNKKSSSKDKNNKSSRRNYTEWKYQKQANILIDYGNIIKIIFLYKDHEPVNLHIKETERVHRLLILFCTEGKDQTEVAASTIKKALTDNADKVIACCNHTLNEKIRKQGICDWDEDVEFFTSARRGFYNSTIPIMTKQDYEHEYIKGQTERRSKY